MLCYKVFKLCFSKSKKINVKLIIQYICYDTGWITFSIVSNIESFLYFDPGNGCSGTDLSNPDNFHFWFFYMIVWVFFMYPFPLFLAVALNTVAVLRLRVESRVLTATEKPTSKLTREESGNRSQGSTLLKRRAAIKLQAASIALVVSFAVTSGPFQVNTLIQFTSGM